MGHVGIYRTIFPLTSETFIGQQISRLRKYDPLVISRSKLSETEFHHVSISDNDLFRFKQILFWLTRHPVLFGSSSHLSALDLIHAHFGADGVYVLPLVKKLGLPLIVTMHGCESEIFRRQLQNPWKNRGDLKYQSISFLRNEKQLMERASTFIAVSKFIQDKLIALGYPKEKVVLHHIGIDTEKFIPAPRDSGSRYILCVGRHVSKKGIDTLLKAFARIHKKHPNVDLVQIGSGELTDFLKALSGQLEIEHKVKFMGAQPYSKVLEWMQNAEIFSLPSQTGTHGSHEGLPMVFKEASACGIPIVSTVHSGIPEAVVNGVTGFLVPERDDQLLSEKLDTLLSDRALGKKIGLEGREYICENFDIQKQTKKLEQIYDSVIERFRSSNSQ